MKVMLINPPDFKMIQGAIPKELGADRMGKYPPLGLLYLAGFAKSKDPSLDIKIVDAITDSLSLDDIEREIAQFSPDVVGVSVYTFTLIDAIDVSGIVKRVRSQAVVVWGGFHPSIYPEESLRSSPDVDIVVAGEAEETFYLILQKLKDGSSPFGIDGVSVRGKDGVINVSKAVPFTRDLDMLSFPDRTMVSYKKHSCILGAGGLTTNILTSRGCPFGCKYCYVNIRSYRLRSIDNVIKEIKECIALGINDFFFVDDLFNISKERVAEFSDRVIAEGISIHWSFRGRVDQIDRAMLEKAKKAGCVRIHYGVESGVPEILKRIGKGTKTEMVRKAIMLSRECGIEVSSNIMIGLPGESPDKTEETIRFLLSLKTNYVQAAVFTPYPETPLYKEGIEKGLLPGDYWREFALRPKSSFEPYIWPEFYTRETVFDKLRALYRRFYLRPSFVIKYISSIKSFAAFKMIFKNAFTLLSLIAKRRSKA